MSLKVIIITKLCRNCALDGNLNIYMAARNYKVLWIRKRKVDTLHRIFEQKLVQACLCAPPVVADEGKLAIVFTYFCHTRTCGKNPNVRYSPGPVPRANYRAQLMNKILYFHKKIKCVPIGLKRPEKWKHVFTIYDGEGGPQREWLP